MKTYPANQSLHLLAIVFLQAFIIFIPTRAAWALQFELPAAKPDNTFDHVINQRGESRVSLFTGLPVVGSSEFAYGVSDKLTLGVFAGSTPFEEAIGIRVRTVLYDNDKLFRIYYCTPIIYYPQMQRANPDPWFITRPNINIEWLSNGNLRYKVGASLIASASEHHLFGDADRAQHPLEAWSAVHGGVSLPVGSNLSFQAELSYITKGFNTIDSFFGGPPILLITGLSYTF